jgi:monovalent cation:H+ antiporter-2, CPA2 family
MLLFYIGMEIDVQLLMSMWQKVLVSVSLMALLVLTVTVTVGLNYGWSSARTVLIAFVLSLSSTAVVMRHLETRRLIRTHAGTLVCGVLFVQDLIVVPMLIVLGFFGTDTNIPSIGTQLIGLLGIVALFFLLWKHRIPTYKIFKRFLDDREHALLFYSTAACGVAALSTLFGLSVGLGAFLAGILVARHYTNTPAWQHLESIKTLLVATFFMSIGALVNLTLLYSYMWHILAIVVFVLVGHTILYASVFRILGLSFRDSIHAAALLAQIGEFSFIIALVGRSAGILGETLYQLITAVVAVSLIASPIWFRLFRSYEDCVDGICLRTHRLFEFIYT